MSDRPEQAAPAARSYQVRTYGCQMNVHDSERIAGLLEDAGYVRRVRVGRRNRYEVDPTVPLRHPAEREHAIGELLRVFAPL